MKNLFKKASAENSADARILYFHFDLTALAGFVLLNNVMYSLNRIEKTADRMFMVKSIDDICDVLAHINLTVPLS